MAAGRKALLAEMNETIQKCSSGQDCCGAGENTAIFADDTRDAILVDDKPFSSPLYDREVGLKSDRGLHCLSVKSSVGLGTRSPHGGPLGSIQETELNSREIRNPAHEAVKSIDLANQMAFSNSTDRGIARHLPDGSGAVREESRACAITRRASGGLCAGVAAANDDDIKILRHRAYVVDLPRHVKTPAAFHVKQLLTCQYKIG